MSHLVHTVAIEQFYVYAPDASSGDAAIHTYTGAGGYAQMFSEWRTANPSVTSGVMFDLWTEWNGISDSQRIQKSIDILPLLPITPERLHITGNRRQW